jgi:hypothetical protein
MKTVEIVAALDEEIDRLERARSLLKRGLPHGDGVAPARKRRTMSPEGRARVAAAQRARWAKVKRG